jgi:hypothetical protein
MTLDTADVGLKAIMSCSAVPGAGQVPARCHHVHVCIRHCCQQMIGMGWMIPIVVQGKTASGLIEAAG